MKQGWLVAFLLFLAHALLFGGWIVDDAWISPDMESSAPASDSSSSAARVPVTAARSPVAEPRALSTAPPTAQPLPVVAYGCKGTSFRSSVRNSVVAFCVR